MTVFRHLLLARFREDASPSDIEDLYTGLATMPETVEGIQRYEFGPELGLLGSPFDLALVADFDSEEVWREYAQHPDHLALVTNLLNPLVEEAVRAQYLVE